VLTTVDSLLPSILTGIVVVSDLVGVQCTCLHIVYYTGTTWIDIRTINYLASENSPNSFKNNLKLVCQISEWNLNRTNNVV
jgi:hypothetical protein